VPQDAHEAREEHDRVALEALGLRPEELRIGHQLCSQLREKNAGGCLATRVEESLSKRAASRRSFCTVDDRHALRGFGLLQLGHQHGHGEAPRQGRVRQQEGEVPVTEGHPHKQREEEEGEPRAEPANCVRRTRRRLSSARVEERAMMIRTQGPRMLLRFTLPNISFAAAAAGERVALSYFSPMADGAAT